MKQVFGVLNVKWRSICRKTAKIIVSGEKKRVVITEKNVEEFLGKPRFHYGQAETEDQVGVATGLAYTTVGGTHLQIEVSLSPGKGKLILTGKLGDVMKESAQAAFSYIRSKAKELGIEKISMKNMIFISMFQKEPFQRMDHLQGLRWQQHLFRHLTGKADSKEVGMTGEITLRGRVLPIGGLKEKSLSAHRAGLNKNYSSKG